MSEPTSGGTRVPLAVVEGALSPRHDSVVRLHRFQGEHPQVQFTSPIMGRHGQFTALIPAGTIPDESREIILKSPDLCGLMDRLDDHFPPTRTQPR